MTNQDFFCLCENATKCLFCLKTGLFFKLTHKGPHRSNYDDYLLIVFSIYNFNKYYNAHIQCSLLTGFMTEF